MAMETYSGRKGKKCVLYLRVSLERQVEGFSLEGQKRYLREWAEFEGMTVVEVYVEAGKSGKSIDGRDEFQRMLNDIATKRIDIDFVVVFKLSRFGRNAKDVLVSLSTLQRYGVNLLCKEDGLDSSTQMGKMMITILGAVAEMERENILAQTMLGRVEKAKQGGWNGGFAPYGFTLVNGKLEVKEDEAHIVRLVFDKFVNEGMGYSPIAAYLNRQGIPKPPAIVSNGREFIDWDTNHIKRMLSNPLYTGRIAFGRTKQQKKEGTDEYKRVKSDDFILSDTIAHEAIVSEEVFQMAQVRQKELSATGNPNVGRYPKHLLSGILKCPQCGGSMYAAAKAWKKADGTRGENLYYMCGHYSRARDGQCQKNSIRGEWVETEVIEYIKLLVENSQFAEDIQRQLDMKMDMSEIENEIAGYKAMLQKLERSRANLERDIDGITDEDRSAERKRQDMNNRLNKIYDEIYDVEDQLRDCEQKKLAVAQEVSTKENIFNMLQTFDRFFSQLESVDKRAVLESLVSEVQLHPKETWKEGQNPVKRITFTFPITSTVVSELSGDEMCHPSSLTSWTLPGQHTDRF